MTAVIVIVGVYLIVGGVWWFVNISSTGYAKDDKLICEAIVKNLGEGGYHVNSLDTSIISVGKMPFISVCSLTIIGFKYYINDVGIIPIWYKSHVLIDKIYKDSKIRNNPNSDLRKKLNLE